MARLRALAAIALCCCTIAGGCSSVATKAGPGESARAGAPSTTAAQGSQTPTNAGAGASAANGTANQTTVASTPTQSPAISSQSPSASTAAAGASSAGATTSPAFVPKNADSGAFDASLFASAAPVDNPWLPLTPGYQATKEGKVTKGSRRLPHRRIFTVTDVVKDVAGVRAVLVLDQDFDGEELAEQALDYLAQDSGGNVWYVGSYTETYEGGRFVNAEDAWLAGIDGAKAGVLMLADPRTGLPSYKEATIPGQGTDSAQVVKQGQDVCVPFKCYSDVLVIREGSENKYFARGAGEIKLAPLSGNAQETEELVNLTRLTANGLEELSAEAMRLDEHARTEAAKVFGQSAQATRQP